MPAPEQSIFRESAIQKYLHKREQTILLRVASPPVMLLFWLFILFLLGSGGLAWSIQVPVTVEAQGVIPEQEVAGQSEGSAIALLFLSLNHRAELRVGQSVTVNISSTPGTMRGIVENVETTAISPMEARSRFNLQGALAQVITGPSLLVTISFGAGSSMRAYAGSLCDALIQVGSRRVISLLPGFSTLFGT